MGERSGGRKEWEEVEGSSIRKEWKESGRKEWGKEGMGGGGRK